MALGATTLRVMRAIVGGGVRLGAAGAVVGLLLAFAATRFLGNILFGVSATDPVSFGGALAVVMACVIAATVVPAWRAARTNPLIALRHH